METHISFGVFLLVLMYTPSCNIISAIFGPCTAGMLSKIWGFLLAITGAIMWMAANQYEIRLTAAICGSLGIYLIIIGKIREKIINSSKHRENIVQKKKEFFYKFLLFPFLLIFSPCILIFLRMLAFLEPSSEFIRKQTWNLLISFKGPTRLCFLFFQVFINRQPSWITWFNICFMCIFNPITTKNIYDRFRWNENQFNFPSSVQHWVKKIFKWCGTYLKLTFNLLSRALTVAVVVTFSRKDSWVCMVICCWILWRIIRYSIPKKEETTHVVEAIVLSLVSVTNLENTQTSQKLRGISSFYNFGMTIFAFFIIYQKRLHDSTESLFIETRYLHLVMTIAISAGFLSILLDLLGAYSCFKDWYCEPIFCFWRKSSAPVQNVSFTDLHDIDIDDKTEAEKFGKDEEGDIHISSDIKIDINKSMLTAASEGNLEHVKSHIEAGADINSRDEDDDTGLHVSARQGHTRVVKTFLENSINVNSRGSKGMTALMIAAEKNYPDILCDLLIKGAIINLIDEYENTAIDYARLNRSDDVLKVFRVWYNRSWHNPSNLNYELLDAVKDGNARLVGCLISTGANPQIRYDDEDYSFFAYYCVAGCFFPYLSLRRREKGLRLKEARKIDYNDYASGEYTGYTGLHIAAHRGHTDVVQVFLDRGINVNIKGNGKTALTIAVIGKHSSTVKLLIDRGAFVDESLKEETQGLLMEDLDKRRDD